jgi:hypothetical protein
MGKRSSHEPIISLYRDERSAIFASVYDCTLVFCFDFLKVSTPDAVNLLALRAVVAPQLLFVDCEVAVSAADLFCLLFPEDKFFMSACCHKYEDTGLHFRSQPLAEVGPRQEFEM